jgi:hypothetical protein
MEALINRYLKALFLPYLSEEGLPGDTMELMSFLLLKDSFLVGDQQLEVMNRIHSVQKALTETLQAVMPLFSAISN